MRRQIIISAVLIVALLGVGAGVAIFLVETAPQPPTSNPARAALPVRGLELRPQTVVEPIVGYGTARADRSARIAAQVSGEVVELHRNLRVGASVDAGELLVRIDDRDYQRQLDRARSLLAGGEAELRRLDVEEKNVDRLIGIATTELEISQREYERVLGLFEAGQAPRRELDVARQGYERARRTLQVLENQKALLPQQRATELAKCDLHRADIALAELSVERCRIRAPFPGRLEAVEVEVGERVSVGTRLLTLLDPDLIEVPIELPVSLRDRVTNGAACRLKLESDREVAWKGQVARIAPSAAPATRTFSLFVEVDNRRQAQPLMPGLFVRAQIDGPTWRDVLIVPRGVIQQEHVYVYDDGLARRRPVSVNRHLFDQAVVDGLRPGEVVITSNLDALFEGAPVRMQAVAFQDETVAAEAGGVGVSPGEQTTGSEAPVDGAPVEASSALDAVRGS